MLYFRAVYYNKITLFSYLWIIGCIAVGNILSLSHILIFWVCYPAIFGLFITACGTETWITAKRVLRIYESQHVYRPPTDGAYCRLAGHRLAAQVISERQA